jgi:SAM-dependent methyltransferase
MNHEEVGRYWNENAAVWTQLARAGYDIYRDAFNTPAFFALLPDVVGLAGLDLGCGEGHNTRLLARRGARVTAVDIAERFITAAQAVESAAPLGIDYRLASAVALPFADHTFDFVAALMSLMDIPETGRALAEAYRVLRPGGFFQFSITHPCYDTPHRRNLRDAAGRTYAIEVGDYFRPLDGDVAEWTFSAAPPAIKREVKPFRVPRFNRTLGEWLNLLVDTGFRLERVAEPRPSDEAVAACPGVQDAQVVAYFLQVRVRKP